MNLNAETKQNIVRNPNISFLARCQSASAEKRQFSELKAKGEPFRAEALSQHENPITNREAVDAAPMASEENNIGPALDAIFATYDDPDVQYIDTVMRTLYEDIETISVSDTDSDHETEATSQMQNGKLATNKSSEWNNPSNSTGKLCNGVTQWGTKNGGIYQEETKPDIGRYDPVKSPKSTSSESPRNGDSGDSGSDTFDFPSSSPEDYTDYETEEESDDFYRPAQIPAGPLPSMPLYDNDFNLLEEFPRVLPVKIKEEVLSDQESGLKSRKVKSILSDSETDSNDSLFELKTNDEIKKEFPEVTTISEGKKKFRYWAATAKRPIDKGEISEKELQAILEEERRRERSSSPNWSDESRSDDSGREDNKRNGLDFYEDNVMFQIGSTTSSRLLVVKEEAVFLEYEETIKLLQQLIQSAPSFYRYEIYQLLYPLIALTYLQMMASDNFPRARVFLNRYTSQLDDSFTSRLYKLMNICRPADVPHRARKFLAGFEKLEMHMSEGAYTQLMEHMEDWTKSQQDKVLTHILVRRYSEEEDPKQRFAPGQPLLQIICWAAPEPLHKKEFTARPVLRSRRSRKKCTLPDRNIHLPPCGKIHTPTPKRMDLQRWKTDEQYRKKLDRKTLPSAYLYTAQNGDEVVTCASFSESIRMLAVGTVSCSIHIFALKASKLVQLKSAQWLKALDTGMAGIDWGMLDPTKKQSRRTLRGHQGSVYRLAFNPDDRYLLSCSEDCSVRLWCLMSWNCMVIYPGHLSPVCCVTYAPLGFYFATASDDCTARIWVQDNKRPVRVFRGHLAELEVCVFHPNRHYLATGSADTTVRLWDIPKGAQVRVFTGHKGRITELAFSPCGRYLVSGGDDCLLIIWDIANERLLHFLSHHKSKINTIQFCSDNNLLVVGGQDCQLTIWDFKKIIQITKSTRSRRRGGLEHTQKKDFLIKSFYSKDAPFYTIRFTRRGLLLAFCVAAHTPDKRLQRARNRREHEERRREDLGEWLEFLDLLKMKAVVSDLEHIE